MRKVIDSLVNGAWLTQSPSFKGQRVKETTYFDDGRFGVVEYSHEGDVKVKLWITKLSFKQRFTTEERIAIRTAASVNPIVYDFQDLVDSATYIDLERPDTVAAVNALEQYGLIGEGRALEILSPPVTDDERYEG